MKKIYFKKILIISVIGLFFVQALYMFAFEPTILSAADDSDDVIISLTVNSGIAISSPADVTMSPTMGITSDTSIGSAIWNVKTNNVTGYHLAVRADTDPALQSTTDSFTDYTPASSGIPETWSVDSSTYQFGYSTYGDDVASATWGTGTSCGTYSTIPTNNLKYLDFTTSDNTIANSSSVTTTSGTDTTVCFATEQNGVFAPSGDYTATITATATTN